MSITIRLDGEVEKRLREEAVKCGLTLEDFIARLAEKAVSPPPSSLVVSGEEWEKAWHAWVASHKPVTWRVDDDRESIYAGRGE